MLTDGLDLWFTDSRQQIDLLHAVLQPQQDKNDVRISSSRFSVVSVCCRGAVTKLVRTAIQIENENHGNNLLRFGS